MYDVQPLALNELEIVESLRLLRMTYPSGTQYTKEFLDWEYNGNPVDQAVGFNAYSNGEIVAHYVTQPITAILFGTPTKGLLSLNTATHPAHQGRGLFTTLASKTYDAASKLGHEFIIGVANANSTPGFVNRLGFQLVSPLVAKVGIGTIKRDRERGPVEFERTWTKESLHWRTANPARQYLTQKEHDRLVIGTVAKRPGVYSILGEFDLKLSDDDLIELKWPAFYPIRLWIGLDDSVNWSRSMFFNVPNRLRPSPLNLIFKDLTGEERQLSTDKVRFQLIDFDAF